MGNNQPIETRFTKVPGKDSVNIYTPLTKYDSIQFSFTEKDYQKTHTVSPRSIKAIDTLQIKFAKSGAIQYRDTIAFTTNTPVKNINESLMQLIRKDSTQVPFTIRLDSLNNTVKVLFDKTEEETYTLFLKPNSVTDFYDTALKTEIIQRFQTAKLTDYGNIAFTLSGTVQYPIIFELLNKDEEVYDFLYLTEDSTIEFKAIEPAKYFVRIIEDANGNQKWDSGSYLEKRQPENVIHFTKEIDIRANWELNETLVVP